ncbi:nucleoside recognition protein [Desulfomicrobium baculatum]|uniref:Nucleoside recognition domain protein n=1 Tax=Desulfomicrobium baculatum (strain DSM 4028 / VKM B-1378 / X) TaxID=525897 RepID=C7LXQ5_DESBD|nr:nucleoside recognition protein [Desulfomicrobium baculatum]ACU91291.1 nucleoside recognition domain protein [Desulfomicrobium baculatum DSM 4028]
MNILHETKDILRRSGRISLELYKIMIPIIIVVKVLQELGLIVWLARPLAPVMHLVGLPGEMGLVWATALVNNIYGSMIVFVSLAGQHDLSVAQVTVLGVMILVAHGLPVELQIVRKSGPRIGFQALLRIGGALTLGWLLSRIYAWGGWLQDASVIIWQPRPESESLLAWGLGQVQNLAMILVIITLLSAVMRVFTAIGLTGLCVRLLAPVLRVLGIGSEAGTLTIVGMIMGLAYGGGMIMHEAHSGKVGSKDIFSSLSLMGLSHSVFEDTLLMVVIGGHVSGLLWARIIFTLVVIALLVRVVAWLGDDFFYRRFFKPVEVYSKPEPCCPGAASPEVMPERK